MPVEEESFMLEIHLVSKTWGGGVGGKVWRKKRVAILNGSGPIKVNFAFPGRPQVFKKEENLALLPRGGAKTASD